MLETETLVTSVSGYVKPEPLVSRIHLYKEKWLLSYLSNYNLGLDICSQKYFNF